MKADENLSMTFSGVLKHEGQNAICVRFERAGAFAEGYLPDAVIERAKELVAQLGQNDIARSIQIIAGEDKGVKKADEVDLNQMSLFDTVRDDDIIEEIKRLDIDHITPMEALNTLSLLQSKLKNRW